MTVFHREGVPGDMKVNVGWCWRVRRYNWCPCFSPLRSLRYDYLSSGGLEVDRAAVIDTDPDILRCFLKFPEGVTMSFPRRFPLLGSLAPTAHAGNNPSSDFSSSASILRCVLSPNMSIPGQYTPLSFIHSLTVLFLGCNRSSTIDFLPLSPRLSL